MGLVRRNQEYQSKLRRQKSECEQVNKETLGYKQDLHERQQQHARVLKETQQKRNPYSTKLTRA
jgi:hypothetical protein